MLLLIFRKSEHFSCRITKKNSLITTLIKIKDFRKIQILIKYFQKFLKGILRLYDKFKILYV